MKKILSFLKLTILLDNRSIHIASKIIYYAFIFFIAFLVGGMVFIILFSEIKDKKSFNVFIDIIFFFIFFLIFIFNLTKYISKTAINLKKINHFPLLKNEIYWSFLLSDLFNFRNFPSILIMTIISVFLIINYSIWGLTSIIFILLYFFSIIIWLRNFFIFFDNFLFRKRIRNNLTVMIIFLGILIYIITLIGERVNIEANSSKIISIFSYLPFGWTGNGIINLISRSFPQAFLYLLLLLIFSFMGIKFGIYLISRKDFY